MLPTLLLPKRHCSNCCIPTTGGGVAVPIAAAPNTCPISPSAGSELKDDSSMFADGTIAMSSNAAVSCRHALRQQTVMWPSRLSDKDSAMQRVSCGFQLSCSICMVFFRASLLPSFFSPDSIFLSSLASAHLAYTHFMRMTSQYILIAYQRPLLLAFFALSQGPRFRCILPVPCPLLHVPYTAYFLGYLMSTRILSNNLLFHYVAQVSFGQAYSRRPLPARSVVTNEI